MKDSPPSSTTTRRSRVRAFVLNSILASTSLGLAVLTCEAGIRLVAPQQLITVRPDLWQPVDTLGWLHRPNVSTTVNTGERTVRVHTDAEGFRVGSIGRIEARRRVLLLGDSFVEALQVEHEQSLAGLLEARLPATVGEPVSVSNAGIDDWTPSQYLLRARGLLPRESYDVVVTALFVGNDARIERVEYVPPRTPAIRRTLRAPQSLDRTELTDALLRPINDWLEMRSQLFILVRNRLSTLRMRLGLSPLYFPVEFQRSEVDSQRWLLTADVCREIQELAEQNGARALFVLIPAAIQVDPAEFSRYLRGFRVDASTVDLEQPTRRLSEELTQADLQVVDVLPAFRAAHDGGTQLYGRVDPHLTPEGNDLLARILLPEVAELLDAS